MNVTAETRQAPIRLLITGGTLDKDYDPVSGELTFPDSAVPHMLTQARVTAPCHWETLMLKDSLAMDDADRQRIRDACLAAPEHHLVITHGTDTMVETATLLAETPALQGRHIVLTGAMRPFRLGDSDAPFNLGAAMLAVRWAPPGVWICMQGELFPWDRVRKNRHAGRFEWC